MSVKKKDCSFLSMPSGLNALVFCALVIHLIVVWSIISMPFPIIWPFHNDTIHRIGPAADFYAVYHAGVNLQAGKSPYLNNNDGKTPYYYPFRYLPVMATFGRLFTCFSPSSAYILWILLLESLFAVVIMVLYRAFECKRTWRLLTALLLLSSPYFLELYMGQFTFAATALCLLSLLIPAGSFVFCSAVLLKIFPIIICPALLRRRKFWRYILLTLIIVSGVSWLYFHTHPEDWKIFSTVNFTPEAGMGSGNYGSIQLIFLLIRDLRWTSIFSYWKPLVGMFRWTVFIITSLLVIFSKHPGVILGACTLLLAHFMTYQHVWEHHLSGVLIIGAFLLSVLYAARWNRRIIFTCLLLLALPTPFILFDTAKNPQIWDPAINWPAYASYIILLPKVLPLITLWLVGCLSLLRAGFRTP